MFRTKHKILEKIRTPLSTSIKIPIRYGSGGAALGAWLQLESDEEEQTEGAVRGGG